MSSTALHPVSFAVHSAKQVARPLDGVLPLYRVVVGCILASLLWNCQFLFSFFEINATVRIQDSFFPALFKSSNLLVALYVIPIAFGIESMRTRNVGMLRIQAIATAVCMFGLCIHQSSYNNVTYLTCFWASLWCVWFSLKIEEPENQLLFKAKTFAILIVSLIFLGGAAGKWTPGYWSGEVLYQIYFLDRDFWFFNYLRTSMDSEALREFATVYSRMVVLVESGCAFLWLLPIKLAAMIGLVVLLGICLFSNIQLFSVMFSLLGLMLVCLHTPKE